MLPVALYVDSVPLGVGYGCRLGIKLGGGGGGVVVADVPLLHPERTNAVAATSENIVAASKFTCCLAIVNRSPMGLLRA